MCSGRYHYVKGAYFYATQLVLLSNDVIFVSWSSSALLLSSWSSLFVVTWILYVRVHQDCRTAARGSEEPRSGIARLGGGDYSPQFAQEGRHQWSQELSESASSCPDGDECRVPSPVWRAGIMSVGWWHSSRVPHRIQLAQHIIFFILLVYQCLENHEMSGSSMTTVYRSFLRTGKARSACWAEARLWTSYGVSAKTKWLQRNGRRWSDMWMMKVWASIAFAR